MPIIIYTDRIMKKKVAIVFCIGSNIMVAQGVAAEQYRSLVSDMTDIQYLMCCQPRALRHTCGVMALGTG